ncbi:MAG: lipoate--protein ligase [Coriobacteriia bacterium]|nr:lipoate--protein ligase [Coriobacteriia bacterium]
MIYIENPHTDPVHNLALEEFMVTCDDRDIVMLWQNDPAVIVGRNQHTENQVDRAFAEEHSIAVIRRLSGGGAVYHDLGNLNFTIIARDATRYKNDFSFFTRPIIEVLNSYGVDARFSGRNDLTVQGKKFSGNAQYNHGNTVLHHGTLLWDSDLEVLAGVLRPKKRIEAREVDSHQARVTNLTAFTPPQITLARFRSDLVTELTEGQGRTVQAALPMLPDALLEKYRSDEWNWGEGLPDEDERGVVGFPASC